MVGRPVKPALLQAVRRRRRQHAVPDRRAHPRYLGAPARTGTRLNSCEPAVLRGRGVLGSRQRAGHGIEDRTVAQLAGRPALNRAVLHPTSPSEAHRRTRMAGCVGPRTLWRWGRVRTPRRAPRAIRRPSAPADAEQSLDVSAGLSAQADQPLTHPASLPTSALTAGSSHPVARRLYRSARAGPSLYRRAARRPDRDRRSRISAGFVRAGLCCRVPGGPCQRKAEPAAQPRRRGGRCVGSGLG